jgi:thiamine monophosphate synthase
LILREKDLNESEYGKLGQEVKEICKKYPTVDVVEVEKPVPP